MSLPQIDKSTIDIQPFNWRGVTRRFMNPGELEVLLALAGSVQPLGVVEFGVNEGRTAKAILDAFPGIRTYQGIDVLPGYVTTKSVQRGEVPQRPGYLARRDKRFDLVLRANGSLDLGVGDLLACDVAFIDGDHGRVAVEHDTALARQIVRPGGIIIWHDYHDLGTVDVREVLDEFHAAGADIVHVADTWLAFERIPFQSVAA